MAGVGASAEFRYFERAWEWFNRRTIVPEWWRHRVLAHARQSSWWIAGVAQASMVQQVMSSIDAAATSGLDYKDWKAETLKALTSGWSLRGAAAAFRLETIWRNAAQSAYSRGRWAQMQTPTMRTMRPYWLFDAVMDSRTSDRCQAADGTCLLTTDPWWQDHYPPLHHRCRSGVRSLRKSQGENRRIGRPETGAEADAQEGFGYSPDRTVPPQHVVPAGLDPLLKAELERKMRSQ